LIEAIYNRFLELTSDPGAAATLVLAEVLSSKEPEFLDIKQAAARLGIGTKKMYELCSAGAVRHRKVGRRIRIATDDLAQVIETSSKRAGDPVADLQNFFRS
jgi:excisionase family DNA binding protein